MQPQPRTNLDKNNLFASHLPLARRLANTFATKHGKPYRELLEQAESLLGQTIAEWDGQTTPGRKYDPTMCNPTSWIYRSIYWGLLDYCTPNKRDKDVLFSTIEAAHERYHWAAPEKFIERFMRELGEDAKLVVQTILNAPQEIIGDTKVEGVLAARRHLRRLGWPKARVDRAWEEVAACL